MLREIADGLPDLADPELQFKIKVTILSKPKNAERANTISRDIQQVFDKFKSSIEGTAVLG